MINSKLQQTLKNHLHPEPTWNAYGPYIHSSVDSDFKVRLDFRPYKTLFPATFFDAPKCHAILAKWIKVGPRLWHTAKKRLWRSPLHEANQPNSGPLLLHMAPQTFEVCSPEPKKNYKKLWGMRLWKKFAEVWTHGIFKVEPPHSNGLLWELVDISRSWRLSKHVGSTWDAKSVHKTTFPQIITETIWNANWTNCHGLFWLKLFGWLSRLQRNDASIKWSNLQ